MMDKLKIFAAACTLSGAAIAILLYVFVSPHMPGYALVP